MQSRSLLLLLMYGGEILDELQSFMKISGRITKFYENFWTNNKVLWKFLDELQSFMKASERITEFY